MLKLRSKKMMDFSVQLTLSLEKESASCSRSSLAELIAKVPLAAEELLSCLSPAAQEFSYGK